MGSSTSKPPCPEEERKRQLQQRGVLIPPTFGVGTSGLTPSGTANLKTPTPANCLCFEHVSAQLPCNRLLREHVAPGLWISAATNTQGSVLASWKPNTTSTAYEGMLCASQQLGTYGQVAIRAQNNLTGTPSISGYFVPTPNCQIHGTMNFSGDGYLGCEVDPTHVLHKLYQKTTKQQPQVEYYRNDPFVEETSKAKDEKIQLQLGSWVNFQTKAFLDMKIGIDVIKSMTGVGVLQARGYTAAVEATVPNNADWRNDTELSYLASFDLNSTGPPLTVTLEQTPFLSSMALSQIITFDRRVTNVLEERCPKIRNTVGWSVQMTTTRPSSDKQLPESQLSAACAWQINRGLGIKLLASPGNGITAGVLLKRWKEPRVTCSLLFGSQRNGFGLQGIGVELETGPPSWQESKDELYSDGKAQASGDTPATKTSLETESNQH